MLGPSASIMVAGAAIAFLSIGIFMWALLTGHFNNLEAQSKMIFDERDLRIRRDWETPLQCAERQNDFGPLFESENNEWGGQFGRTKP